MFSWVNFCNIIDGNTLILFWLFRNSLKFCQNVDSSFCFSLSLQISECSSQQIRGLSSLRSSLATLSIHQSTETMMVQFRLNTTLQYTLFMQCLVCCVLMRVLCYFWHPPVDPGPGGERVLTVGGWGGGVRLSRHSCHPRVEKSDHAGHEPQLHQHHRQLSGETRPPKHSR